MIHNKMSLVCRLAISMVALGLVGCEPAPLPLHVAVEPGSYGLADPASGRFNWPVSENGFQVTKPPIYSSLIGLTTDDIAEIDRAAPLWETESADVQIDPVRRAELLRFFGTNPDHPFELRPERRDVASIALDDGPRQIELMFDNDGERLLIRADDSLRMLQLPDTWKSDVLGMQPPQDRSQSVLWKISLPAASTSASRTIDFNHDHSSIIALDDQGAAVFDAKTGRRSKSIPASHPLLDLDTAAEADAFFALDAEGQILHADSTSSRWKAIGERADGPDRIESGQCIGVNAMGDGVIAIRDGKPITVWVRERTKVTTTSGEERLAEPVVAVAWPPPGRLWIDFRRAHSDAGAAAMGEPTEPAVIEKSFWRPYQYWNQTPIESPSMIRAPTRSMVTVLGLRRMRSGSAMWCVWDQNHAAGGYSVPTNLYSDEQLAKSSLPDRRRPVVAISRDGSRVAYVDPGSSSNIPTVRVIYRGTWEQRDHDVSLQWRNLLSAEDFDINILDQAALTLLRLPEAPDRYHSVADLYERYIVSTLGKEWEGYVSSQQENATKMLGIDAIRDAADAAEIEKAIEEYPQFRETHQEISDWTDAEYQAKVQVFRETTTAVDIRLANLEKWLDRGSVSAKCVSAARHMAAAWKARGAGMGYSVSRDGWNEFERRCGAVIEDLQSVIDGPRPPPEAFDIYFEAKLTGGNVSALELEPLVQRMVVLYPAEVESLVNVGWYLLPRWGGSVGDTSSFIDASVKLLPLDKRDLVYGKTTLRLSDIYKGNENIFYSLVLDANRTFKGINRYLDSHQTTNFTFLAATVWTASYANVNSSSQMANHVIRENFNYPFGGVYERFPMLFAEAWSDRPSPR